MNNEKVWSKEALFHTTMDCQVAFYATRRLDRKDMEKIIKYLQLGLDLGCYDDEPEPDGDSHGHD